MNASSAANPQPGPQSPAAAVDGRAVDDTHTSQAWMYRSEAFAEDLDGRSSRFAGLNIPPAKKRLSMAMVVLVVALVVCAGVAVMIRWT